MYNENKQFYKERLYGKNVSFSGCFTFDFNSLLTSMFQKFFFYKKILHINQTEKKISNQQRLTILQKIQ